MKTSFMGSSTSQLMEKEKQEEEIPDDDQNLKTRISSHPLYGLLLETHLDCLKVGGNRDDLEEESDALRNYMKQLDNQNPSTLGESELDHFMEAYCLALRKLKEAMEEPQQKSMTFITNMHLQLKEITATTELESHLDDLPDESPVASFRHRHRHRHRHHTSGERIHCARRSI